MNTGGLSLLSRTLMVTAAVADRLDIISADLSVAITEKWWEISVSKSNVRAKIRQPVFSLITNTSVCSNAMV